MNKSIDVIGVQMDFGASKRGVAMGPAAIRYAGLLDDLKGMGFDVHDKGDILPLLRGKTSETMRKGWLSLTDRVAPIRRNTQKVL